MAAVAMSDSSIMIHIEAFASAAEHLGQRRLSHDLPDGSSITDLWTMLIKDHPGLQGLDTTIAFAINNQVVARSSILRDGDTLAILPPVSGG